MNKKLLALLITASTTLIACGPTQQSNTNTASVQASVAMSLGKATQTDIDDIAATLDVKYKVLTNIPTDKCDKSIADGNCFEVELSFTASQVINSKGWDIHFSQIVPIQSFESDEFKVEHINGDLQWFHRDMVVPCSCKENRHGRVVLNTVVVCQCVRKIPEKDLF